MRVYLVRHGQTAMNFEGRTLGQTDADLDSEGCRQLSLLTLRFQGVKLNKILSSDLKRAQVTAQAVSRATGAPITVTAALRERSMGEWEGRDEAEVNRDLLRFSRCNGTPLYDVRTPGGESHRDIWERTWPIVEPLMIADEDLAIVSHGGTCRVMLSQFLRANLDTTFCFKFDNSSVTRLDRRPDGAFLLSVYNDTHHVSVPSEADQFFRGKS